MNSVMGQAIASVAMSIAIGLVGCITQNANTLWAFIFVLFLWV